MKTDFTILWVDDHRDFANSIIAELQKWLDEKGFQLNVVMHKDETGVLENIKKYEIELIVIDYRLPKKTGDEIIEDIREKSYYQDIVFYSEGDLPMGAYDGVFFSSREDAKARIKRLIELKLRRSTDPASIRGWIVADAIELESMLTDLLGLCFTQKEGYTFANRILHDHKAPIDFGRKVDIFKGIINDLVAWMNVLPNKDEEKIKRLSDCNTVFKDFKEEIVEVRNAVAHQKTEVTEAGIIIKKKTAKAEVIPLEDATFVKIRNDLRKHYRNLIDLHELIC